LQQAAGALDADVGEGQASGSSGPTLCPQLHKYLIQQSPSRQHLPEAQ